jgi:hypothetical protein
MEDLTMAETIADLKREIELRDKRIAELRGEIDTLRALVRRAEEEVREDIGNLTEHWISLCDMHLNEDGLYVWDEDATGWTKAVEWRDKYVKVVREWNKHIGEFNAKISPRNVGRPLEASDAQCADVLKRHKEGQSLRFIAEATNLGLRTVRTVVGRKHGTDRTSQRHERHKRIVLEREEMRRLDAKKQGTDALPRRINEVLSDAREFLKDAREGRGRST